MSRSQSRFPFSSLQSLLGGTALEDAVAWAESHPFTQSALAWGEEMGALMLRLDQAWVGGDSAIGTVAVGARSASVPRELAVAATALLGVGVGLEKGRLDAGRAWLTFETPADAARFLGMVVPVNSCPDALYQRATGDGVAGAWLHRAQVRDLNGPAATEATEQVLAGDALAGPPETVFGYTVSIGIPVSDIGPVTERVVQSAIRTAGPKA